jgi:hypothetical protein
LEDDLDEACGRVLQLNHLMKAWRYDEKTIHVAKQERAVEILDNLARALRIRYRLAERLREYMESGKT